MPLFPVKVVPGLLGGRLQGYLKNWELITADRWVLNTVRHGLTWEFKTRPALMRGTSWLHAPIASQNIGPIRSKVSQMLLSGSVERVVDPGSPGFYSRFFVVPKKTPGEWRAILDLKALNANITSPKFKMETAESIRRDLAHAAWTTSIDLIDAYMHVPIHPRFRHFLRFVVDGVAYQYKALPAGLCTAPWAFTRLIAAVKVFLHRMGICLHQYIDDWLIRAMTYGVCLLHTNFTVTFIHNLGFFHHDDKSQLLPLQDFIFLGYRFLLYLSKVFPTPDRIHKILLLVKFFLANKALSARMWQRLLGLLAATERLVPQGLLHMRPIQLQLHATWDAQRQPQSALVPITPQVRLDLLWWAVPAHIMVGVPIQYPEPEVQILTDASLHGWGAHLQSLTVSGVWTETEALLHINILEFQAVTLALQHFLPHIRGKVVLIATDNTTVVAYINRQGGTKSPSLCHLAYDLLSWTQLHHILLRARHIPGHLNVLADLLSRRHQVIPTEWEIHSNVFRQLCRLWGSPHVDLFSTYLNHCLPVYVSPMPDSNALAVDSLSLSWEGFWGYAFPPTALLARVLQKLRRHTCQILLLAPCWPGQAWFPDLLELLVDLPRELPRRVDLLSQNRGRLLHPDLYNLHLHAWKLSSVPSQTVAFRATLPCAFRSPNEPPLWRFTSQSGKSTLIGVSHGRLIHSVPLLHK